MIPVYRNYIDDVLEGRIAACEYVKLACSRHLQDLEILDDYYFDEKAGKRAAKIFEILRHSKGDFAGRTFELSPWQEFIVYMLFGWRVKETEKRRFRIAYIEVARKNGKSTFAAGIGLYLAFCDNESGAEVYTAATTRKQACIVHDEAIQMVKSSPILSKELRMVKYNISLLRKRSKFEPLGADSQYLDGLNVHGAIIDELHAHRNDKLFSVIETATGSRSQPLILCITTAGNDVMSFCYSQREYAIKIIGGSERDESFFGIIYTLDQGDDYKDPNVWEKANPNLNVSCSSEDLLIKINRISGMPSRERAFQQLHMNCWTNAIDSFIPIDRWDSCPNEEFELEGMDCYLSIDLASRVDFTAACFVFVVGDYVVCIPHFFLPSESIEERGAIDSKPYDFLAKQGYIITTPGNVADYSFIFEYLMKESKKYNVKSVVMDQWNAQDMASKFDSEGIHCEFVRQGFRSLSPPTKYLESLIISKKLIHYNHPVLRWMASNLIVESDSAGNVKPNRRKSKEKIDGIVALVMALAKIQSSENQSFSMEIVA